MLYFKVNKNCHVSFHGAKLLLFFQIRVYILSIFVYFLTKSGEKSIFIPILFAYVRGKLYLCSRICKVEFSKTI